MKYLGNAFSLAMLPGGDVTVQVREVRAREAREILRPGFTSCVGHESTAQLLSHKLHLPVEFNRVSVSIREEDILVVAQLMGERKEYKDMSREEIATYPIKFFLVRIIPHEE